MLREKAISEQRKAESINDAVWGGSSRSSDEGSVMELEQRGPVIRFDTTRQLTEPSIRRNLMNQTKPKPCLLTGS
jgi:hypothetical protein